MPQKLPTTFSSGPISNSLLTEGTLQIQEEKKPILEFDRRQPLGVQQVAPASELATLSEGKGQQAATLLESNGQQAENPFPTGVAFTPSVDVLSRKGSALQTRQLWEGTVMDICNDTFVARLRDCSVPENPDEEVTFEVNEVDDWDRELVRTGASFYWVVGKLRSPMGTKSNISFLRFKRVPAWTRRSLDSAARRAKKLEEQLRERE